MSKHLRLPLQVDLCIDVGCIDGNMAQPRTDGVDVDSGPKQVRSCSVPDGVRADGLLNNVGWEVAAARTQKIDDKKIGDKDR